MESTRKQFAVEAALVGVAIAVTLLSIGMQSKREPNLSSKEPIRIGAIFMLGGVGSIGSNWGENSRRGADVAVQEINEAGGINGRPLEIVYEDNQGDNPKQAVNALQSLIARDIKIVIGPNWTPSGLAIAPIVCEQGVVMISPTLGVAEFNETCDYIFNLWAHDFLISERLGHYLYEQGFRRVAILGSLQAWEQEQAEAIKRGFEQAGGTVVAFELPQKDQNDFRAEATKIKASNPEAVVFTNFAFEHISARQLREIGVIVSFYSILMDDERIRGAQGAFERAVVITSFAPTDEFTQKFENHYGTKIDIGADTSYDAVMLLAEAMRKTGSTEPAKLKEYLNSLKEYSGVSGLVTFDGEGGVTKEPRFQMVKDGKLVPLEGSL